MIYLKRTGSGSSFRYWFWHPKLMCVTGRMGLDRPSKLLVNNRPTYRHHPLDKERPIQRGDVVFSKAHNSLCNALYSPQKGVFTVFSRKHDTINNCNIKDLTLVSPNIIGGELMGESDPNAAFAFTLIEQSFLEGMGSRKLDNYVENNLMRISIGVDTMKQFHNLLLGSVFPWAGSYRQEPVWVGRHNSQTPDHQSIPNLVQNSFQEFHNPLLRQAGKSKAHLIAALCEIHRELALIHPFKDGNGRVIRKICEVIALQRGYKIEWQLDQSNGRKKYHYSVRKAVHSNQNYYLQQVFQNSVVQMR